ncbi:MAG: hypothetical protein IH937_03805, partial [Acidobacteria bacterium]|nr:hypothetical protein [Acidobacteriota bacterium]
MRDKRSALILLVGALLGAVGCQEASQPTRFGVRVPEGSGLHHTQTVRVGINAQAGSEVQLTLEPEGCGVLAGPRVTTDEHNTANVVFTAGEVETNCQVTVTGTLGDQTSTTHIMVHPPKVEAQVIPWTGSAPA